MSPRFNPEAIAEEIHTNHYLSWEPRERFHITAPNGVFTKSGKALDTPHIYVLFPDDRLYGASIYHKNMHHSYLSAGLPVKGAGALYFCKGYLITVSNESGHYLPTKDEMHNALLEFLRLSQKGDLLFEDHSEMDETLPFDGIRYYKVSLVEGHLLHESLNEQELISYIKNARNQACEQYESNLPPPAPVNFEEELIIQGSLLYYTKLEPVEKKEIPEDEIFNFPHLCELTCLSHFQEAKKKGTLTSRFKGGEDLRNQEQHRRKRSISLNK